MSDTVSEQISLQTKFSLLPDEEILVESEVVYRKSAFNIIICKAFLTNYRLVVCSTGAMGAQITLGLLASAVVSSLKLRKITFQALLPEIQSMKKNPGLGSQYIISTQSGTEYIVTFNKKDNERWVNGMKKLGVQCSF